MSPSEHLGERADQLLIGHVYHRPRIAVSDWGYTTLRRVYATQRHPIEVHLRTTDGADVRGRLEGIGAGTVTIHAPTDHPVRVAANTIAAYTVIRLGDTIDPLHPTAS